MNKKFNIKLFRLGTDGLVWYNLGQHNNEGTKYEIIAPYASKPEAQKLMAFLAKSFEVEKFFKLMNQSPDALSKEFRKRGWKGTI